VAGVCSTSKHPGLWVSRLGSLIEKKEKERKTEKLAGEGGRECVWEGVLVAGSLEGVGMERVDITSGRTCETSKRKVKERKPHVFTN